MPRPDLFDEDNLRHIAIDYYENKKSQKDIAESWGVARAAISVALRRAIDLKIVRVRVVPEERPHKLHWVRRNVMRKFNLEDVQLAPAHIDAQGDPTPDVIPYIAGAAAAYLDDVLTNESKLALSGGRRFNRQVVQHLQPHQLLPDMEVLPLSGFIVETANVGDASLLAFDLSTLYGAKHSWLPIPAIVETQEQCKTAKELPIIRDVLKKIEKEANIFLLTLFAPFSPNVLSKGVLKQEQIDKIMSKKPVCNIDLWFYTLDGECVNNMMADPPYYLTGYNINNLRTKVENDEAQVILVAGGFDAHVAGIQAALRARLANVLITDHITAMKLIGDL